MNCAKEISKKNKFLRIFTVMEMFDHKQILVFVPDNPVQSMILLLVEMLILQIRGIYIMLMYNPYQNHKILFDQVVNFD